VDGARFFHIPETKMTARPARRLQYPTLCRRTAGHRFIPYRRPMEQYSSPVGRSSSKPRSLDRGQPGTVRLNRCPALDRPTDRRPAAERRPSLAKPIVRRVNAILVPVGDHDIDRVCAMNINCIVVVAGRGLTCRNKGSGEMNASFGRSQRDWLLGVWPNDHCYHGRRRYTAGRPDWSLSRSTYRESHKWRRGRRRQRPQLIIKCHVTQASYR